MINLSNASRMLGASCLTPTVISGGTITNDEQTEAQRG